jgi:adenosylcobyric acid synthase
VAPFKAQNMSNNARVVPIDPDDARGEAGEIGSAQYFQALAARVPPHVDMNPVLLKPERDTASQVVVRGRVDVALARVPWRERSARLAHAARAGFERLAARHEVVVVEGAGSPAEINLAPNDYVNLDTARWARALGTLHALLVADIDRGGAFAHLYGTWSLLPPDLRPAVHGFVLNRFRGDPALLAPGPEQLRALTGVPLLGVLPMTRDHGLPDEDGLHAASPGLADGPRIAIVAWPHLSNLDEFQPLAAVASLRWARAAAELDGADWIVLPGSKQVSGDLAWLRARGLDAAIRRHAGRGGRVLGICGGLQALGTWLHDPDGVDGEPYEALPGLGLLPLATRYAAPKRLRAAAVRFGVLGAPWHALSGVAAPAYEIRCGRTAVDAPGAVAALHASDGEALGWQAGPVLGVAAHGLFEEAAVLRALFGGQARTLEASLEELADLVEAHLGGATLREVFGA